MYSKQIKDFPKTLPLINKNMKNLKHETIIAQYEQLIENIKEILISRDSTDTLISYIDENLKTIQEFNEFNE